MDEMSVKLSKLMAVTKAESAQQRVAGRLRGYVTSAQEVAQSAGSADSRFGVRGNAPPCWRRALLVPCKLPSSRLGTCNFGLLVIDVDAHASTQ